MAVSGASFGSIVADNIVLAGSDVQGAAVRCRRRLLRASGVTVLDGNYTLTFEFWDAGSGGTGVCSDTTLMGVQDGLFDAVIDACEVEDFRSPPYLEVTVDDGVNPPETFSPRQLLHGAPYVESLAGGAVV